MADFQNAADLDGVLGASVPNFSLISPAGLFVMVRFGAVLFVFFHDL